MISLFVDWLLIKFERTTERTCKRNKSKKCVLIHFCYCRNSCRCCGVAWPNLLTPPSCLAPIHFNLVCVCAQMTQILKNVFLCTSRMFLNAIRLFEYGIHFFEWKSPLPPACDSCSCLFIQIWMFFFLISTKMMQCKFSMNWTFIIRALILCIH